MVKGEAVMLRPEDVIKFRKEREEYNRNYVREHPEKYESSHKLDEWVKSQQLQGKIINPFIENWLEGEIVAARIALTVGMLLTVLIKGQIFIWIIMYIAYRGRVKHVREKAYESDRRNP
jgi:hypothetical protein